LSGTFVIPIWNISQSGCEIKYNHPSSFGSNPEFAQLGQPDFLPVLFEIEALHR
jgi:hypothetical protein